MKNYVSPGNVLTLPSPYDVASGGGVKSGLIFGIACSTAESGDDVDVDTVGVYDLVKVSANAFAVGAAVYWDDTAKVATSTSTDNTKIGVAVAAAANPSATVRVRLSGF